VEVMYEYRAFGEQLKRLDGNGDETGDTAKYSYGGKELDGMTNLYYFNARFYDATIGRFINVDPVQDGSNWYVYCNNNPLCFVDPTGLNSGTELADSHRTAAHYHLTEKQIEDFKKTTKEFDKELITRIADDNHFYDNHVFWKAHPIEYSYNGKMVFGDGIALHYGTAVVNFVNSETKEEFNAMYTFYTTNAAGFLVTASGQGETGILVRFFKKNTTYREIAESYTGNFITGTVSCNTPIPFVGAGVSIIHAEQEEKGEAWRGSSVSLAGGVGLPGFLFEETHYVLEVIMGKGYNE
jgi:RHS repeat-associated protein